MNNSDWLHTNNDFSLLNNLPAAIGLKDLNSTYSRGNHQLAKYMGYKKADDIIGLSDTHIKSEMVELSEQFIDQDNAVIKIGAQQQHLDIGHYPNGELQIHLSTKKP